MWKNKQVVLLSAVLFSTLFSAMAWSNESFEAFLSEPEALEQAEAECLLLTEDEYHTNDVCHHAGNAIHTVREGASTVKKEQWSLAPSAEE